MNADPEPEILSQEKLTLEKTSTIRLALALGTKVFAFFDTIDGENSTQQRERKFKDSQEKHASPKRSFFTDIEDASFFTLIKTLTLRFKNSKKKSSPRTSAAFRQAEDSHEPHAREDHGQATNDRHRHGHRQKNFFARTFFVLRAVDSALDDFSELRDHATSFMDYLKKNIKATQEKKTKKKTTKKEAPSEERGRYQKRGASASKNELHEIFKAKAEKGNAPKKIFSVAGKNLFAPGVRGFLDAGASGDEPKIFFLHSDGSGSKAVVAYLYWKETGSLAGFRSVAEDALVMNTDDLLTVGAIGASGGFAFTSLIDRCLPRIPQEVIAEILAANDAFTNKLRSWGIPAQLIGGETADLGEAVRTLTVNATVATWIHEHELIDAAKISPNAFIVGLASSGQTSYEDKVCSGLGSNGFTSARHDLLSKRYLHAYPETVSDTTAEHWLYTGDCSLDDVIADQLLKTGQPEPMDETLAMRVGEALISPTRSYLPVVQRILEHFTAAKQRDHLQGILHLTGGGQTKCLRFGENIHYVKDKLFPLPGIFRLLAQKTPAREMYQVYNCGHRLELIVTSEDDAQTIIDIASTFKLHAQIIGHTESNTSANNTQRNTLTIKTEDAVYEY